MKQIVPFLKYVLGWIWYQIRNIRLTAALFAFLFFLYFCFNFLTGDRGLIAWASIAMALEKKQAVLEQLQAQIDYDENHLKMLRNSAQYPDLLDETARSTLHLILPDEHVILERDEDKPI